MRRDAVPVRHGRLDQEQPEPSVESTLRAVPERLRTFRILQTDQVSRQDFGPRGDSVPERLLKTALSPSRGKVS
ncbi:hypothetical protein B0G77_4385 [Paraburkholderia sp. BL10I2N1]|nr:hypothetical protein B0G77_4385 [Paraburkholderia sp. BL10I2N1]